MSTSAMFSKGQGSGFVDRCDVFEGPGERICRQVQCFRRARGADLSTGAVFSKGQTLSLVLRGAFLGFVERFLGDCERKMPLDACRVLAGWRNERGLLGRYVCAALARRILHQETVSIERFPRNIAFQYSLASGECSQGVLILSWIQKD